MFDEDAANGEPSGTHALAASLVRELGPEDAIRVCRANYWDGVLRIISAQPIPVTERSGAEFFIA